jgi:hypothetical protein
LNVPSSLYQGSGKSSVGLFPMSMTAGLMQGISIIVLLLFSLCHIGLALAEDDAAVLREKYAALMPQLSSNQFQRMLYLDSVESSSLLKGDIYAVVDYSFAVVSSAFSDSDQGPSNWCNAMMLHPNIKYCHASGSNNDKKLSVNMGKKTMQSLAFTYQMIFNYHAAATTQEYFRVNLNADSGPLGTRDCRIALEAVAIDGKRTFLHLAYSCSYGMAGLMVMKTYLATIGRDKIGFTDTVQSDGKPGYIGGVRGMVERNTMRYYLAIDAYLSALTLPIDKRLEKRLSKWFSGAEQYPRQLHEADRQEYMQIKYQEYKRQQAAQ